jgi:hypothetical protein
VITLENLATSGATYPLSDGNNTDFIIAVDKSVFTMLPNEWATAKYRSLFCASPSLKAKVESDSENVTARTLELVLFHEIGHAFSVANGYLPPWYKIRIPQLNNNCFPFLDNAFHIKNISFQRTLRIFDVFDSLGFYGWKSPCRDTSQVRSLFDLLMESPYPTLYSVQNPYEYFADAFASYLHCEFQGRKYVIYSGTLEYTNGITQDRCKHIREAIAEMLQTDASAGGDSVRSRKPGAIPW